MNFFEDPSKSVHIEFHASQRDPRHSGAACIHHCLLRVQSSDDVPVLAEGLTTIGDAFAHFAYLETIVLETGRELGTDSVQSLTKVLRKGSMAEVRHRTCDEAHKLALQAKKSPSRCTSAELLSTFWCLREYNWQWNEW